MTDERTEHMTERTTIGGVPVVEAFVDWNMQYSNPPSLVVMLDDTIEQLRIARMNTWRQVDIDRFVMHEDGLFIGFQFGDDFENRRTYTIALPRTYVGLDGKGYVFHEDSEEGTWMYDHVVRSDVRQNRPGIEVLGVSTHEAGGATSRTITKDKAEEIIDRYVNGDLGSDIVSYWCWRRATGTPPSDTWHGATTTRQDYEGYTDCEVELVEGSIRGWVPAKVDG